MDQMKKNAPNSAFDTEYRTQWRDEVDFLEQRGIYYTIRKREGEYGIPTYKYTKTADLFVALADFYLRNRRDVKSKATYTGKPKYQQQTFLKKDGTVNERYVKSYNKKYATGGIVTEMPMPIKNIEEIVPPKEVERVHTLLEQAAEGAMKLVPDISFHKTE